jgi:SAM-dependent methyltransferase
MAATVLTSEMLKGLAHTFISTKEEMAQPFAEFLKEKYCKGESPANEQQEKAIEIASKFDAAVADLRKSRELFDPMRRNASLKREMEEFLRRYPGYYNTLHGAIDEKPTLCDSEVLTQLRAFADAPVPMRADAAAPMRADAPAPRHAAPRPRGPQPRAPMNPEAARAFARARVLDEYPDIAEWMMRDSATVYLDIGCADGSITAAIAGKLRLKPGRALACDIVDRVAPDARKSIQFELSSATALPYKDASVDFITMHMVAHHFSDPLAIFCEARRVSRDGALLLLREHDPPPRDLEAITERLNIEHALWACMINKEQTPEEFLVDYRAPAGYANYRPLAAFIKELGAVGFHCIGHNDPRPGDKNYAAYALFEATDKKPVCASTDSLSSSAP